MLTQQAIEKSSEIEAINEQLELTAERQDYAEARQWTNYLTLDPVRLVQNVLGGGDVQRDRIAIAQRNRALPMDYHNGVVPSP